MILDDLMVLLHDFTIPKALILRPFFASFSDPISGPSLEGDFGPSWPTKVPIYTPQDDFGPILGTQDFQERPFGRPRPAQKPPKRLVVKLRVDALWPPWTRPVPQRDTESHSHRFGTVLAHIWERQVKSGTVRHRPLNALAAVGSEQ